MDKVEVVVVGAGLAGLAAAIVLAEEGAEVLVVERGEYPGSKNVSGGRLYLGPVRPFLPPELWEEAPFERQVTRERLTVMAPRASVTVDLTSDRFRERRHSYTVLRATFDRWLADQATSRGALVVPGYKVDGLLTDGHRVMGIKSGEAEIRADVVVCAEGVLGFLAEEAGLRQRLDPRDYAVGAKEIVELPADRIQERFGLAEGEGAAQLFLGAVTGGMVGGGFLYTNRQSLSLGIVIGIHDLMEHGRPGGNRDAAGGDPEPLDPHALLEAFKARPEIQPLITGGHSVEYSAHAVLEGGRRAVRTLVGDGILLAGDAAGLAQNLGFTVRGMDFALASGAIAGRAILHARRQGDFSAKTLAIYKSMLQDSFVLQDLVTYRHLPSLLENRRLFGPYPQAVCQVLEELFWFGEHPRRRLVPMALAAVRKHVPLASVLRDLIAARKV